MRHLARFALPLVLAATLAACSGEGSSDGVLKDVADLRADVQRLDRENGKLKEQLGAAERRIGGLEQDVLHVRELAVTVKPAASPEGAVAATDGAGVNTGPGVVPGQPGAVTIPNAPELKAFLESEAGRKAVAETVKALQDEQSAQRNARMVDGMVDRFAKQANLTEDQTKQMKTIIGKQAVALRDAWQTLRDAPLDMAADQREQLRTAAVAKTDEVRKQTDEQVKNVLSQTQFEQYQQEEARLQIGARGVGVQGGNTNGTGGRRNPTRGQGGAGGQQGN